MKRVCTAVDGTAQRADAPKTGLLCCKSSPHENAFQLRRAFHFLQSQSVVTKRCKLRKPDPILEVSREGSVGTLGA